MCYNPWMWKDSHLASPQGFLYPVSEACCAVVRFRHHSPVASKIFEGGKKRESARRWSGDLNPCLDTADRQEHYAHRSSADYLGIRLWMLNVFNRTVRTVTYVRVLRIVTYRLSRLAVTLGSLSHDMQGVTCVTSLGMGEIGEAWFCRTRTT